MPLLWVASILPRNCGSCLMAWAMFPGAICSSCDALTTVTGVGAVIPVTRSREPVMVTSLSEPSASVLLESSEDASCACAGAWHPSAVIPTMNDVSKRLRSRSFIPKPPQSDSEFFEAVFLRLLTRKVHAGVPAGQLPVRHREQNGLDLA